MARESLEGMSHLKVNCGIDRNWVVWSITKFKIQNGLFKDYLDVCLGDTLFSGGIILKVLSWCFSILLLNLS